MSLTDEHKKLFNHILNDAHEQVMYQFARMCMKHGVPLRAAQDLYHDNYLKHIVTSLNAAMFTDRMNPTDWNNLLEQTKIKLEGMWNSMAMTRVKHEKNGSIDKINKFVNGLYEGDDT